MLTFRSRRLWSHGNSTTMTEGDILQLNLYLTKNAIKVPGKFESPRRPRNSQDYVQDVEKHKHTVSVFQGLLLFGGLGDDFDPLAEEDTDVSAVAVEHLDGQHEVLSLVRVGYVQGFGCAIILEDIKHIHKVRI